MRIVIERKSKYGKWATLRQHQCKSVEDNNQINNSNI